MRLVIYFTLHMRYICAISAIYKFLRGSNEGSDWDENAHVLERYLGYIIVVLLSFKWQVDVWFLYNVKVQTSRD